MMLRGWMAAGLVALAGAPVMAAPEEGDKAPGISASSWMNLPEGLKTLAASDLKGRVLMVEFWATW